jgi:hypothetical protein
MFKKKIKANWKTKGFKARSKNGVVEGKIYSAYPMRIGVALAKTFKAIFIMLVLTVGFAFTPLAESDTLNILVALGWLYSIVFVLPYTLLFYGKPIKITHTDCTIGRKEYRLADMTSFTMKQVSGQRSNDYYIAFNYGKKRQAIKIPNTFDNQLLVIADLNRELKRMYENIPPATVESRSSARSADF